jgi:hypothetical protein
MNFYLYLKKRIEFSNVFIESNALEYRDLRILEVIFLNSSPGNTYLNVNDIIVIKSLGSRATIHRALLRMRESEVIEFFHHAGDYRTKYLKPATKAVIYFSKLEHTMLTFKN